MYKMDIYTYSSTGKCRASESITQSQNIPTKLTAIKLDTHSVGVQWISGLYIP